MVPESLQMRDVLEQLRFLIAWRPRGILRRKFPWEHAQTLPIKSPQYYIAIDFDSTFMQVEALEELADIVLKKAPEKPRVLEEIKQITTPSLAEGSRRQLRETRSKFDQMLAALKKSERSMEPVLTKFHDQVLYLKHNLNASAIASLRGEATSIQTEIATLIADMNASITKADEFIKAMQ